MASSVDSILEEFIDQLFTARLSHDKSALYAHKETLSTVIAVLYPLSSKEDAPPVNASIADAVRECQKALGRLTNPAAKLRFPEVFKTSPTNYSDVPRQLIMATVVKYCFPSIRPSKPIRLRSN